MYVAGAQTVSNCFYFYIWFVGCSWWGRTIRCITLHLCIRTWPPTNHESDFVFNRAHRNSIAEKKVRSFDAINQKQPTRNNEEREREREKRLFDRKIGRNRFSFYSVANNKLRQTMRNWEQPACVLPKLTQPCRRINLNKFTSCNCL